MLCINHANSVFVKSWKNERHLKCLLFTWYSFTSDDTIFEYFSVEGLKLYDRF